MPPYTVSDLTVLLSLQYSFETRQLLRSEGIQGPWRSYRSDTDHLPWDLAPRERSTVHHALDSVNNIVDLVGVDGEIIDKSSWTIDHHCARLLLLWSEALTGPEGPPKVFKEMTVEDAQYEFLFNVYVKINNDYMEYQGDPNLLSSEPGVDILWTWNIGPVKPRTEISRGVTMLTFDEAKRTADAVFNITSSGYEILSFFNIESQSDAGSRLAWEGLVHRLAREIRHRKLRQINILVYTYGPGIWVSPSATLELAEAKKDWKFLCYNQTRF
jgi:hypothetical protein